MKAPGKGRASMSLKKPLGPPPPGKKVLKKPSNLAAVTNDVFLGQPLVNDEEIGIWNELSLFKEGPSCDFPQNTEQQLSEMDKVDDLWSAESFNNQTDDEMEDPLALCSPLDAEGKQLPNLEVQEIENLLKNEEFEVENEDFNLLDFVVNSELPVDDPSFKSFIEPDKKLLKAPRAPRIKCKTKEAKYRRMRDLNNLASKRCRENRKTKQQLKIEEMDQLEEKNKELKMKVKVLGEQVTGLKRAFLQRVKRPEETFDLDAFLEQQFDI